jgi:glutaminyl-tRNA synthetase
MGAYIVKCNEIIKDENGQVLEIRCTADLETGNGVPVDGRKVKGTIHWLSKDNCVDSTVMLYDFLFDIENTGDIPEDKTYDDYLNTSSAVKIEGCKVEPSLAEAKPSDKFQFVRCGYFVKDTKNPNTFNRIVGLKDSFPKNK